MTVHTQKPELVKVEAITVPQSGNKFLEDQAMMEEMVQQLADQRKQIDRLNDQILTLRLKLSTTTIHLFKFLDEKEGEFDNDERFDSPEIARDYIDAALFCQNYFGRKTNRINDAMSWYNSQDSLPFSKA